MYQNKLAVILKSYAKLNLYLQVLNKRKDNYHNLSTIFERINLADKISLSLLPGKKIRIKCRHPDVPLDDSNLCYRAARILQDKYRVKAGVLIEIVKNTPVGAGLGGGSSNAATALLGLNKLWRLRLDRAALVRLARKIGSDVAFFLYDASFAQGTARGDAIKPLRALNRVRLWHILVIPRIKVSTPLIYKKWDERLKQGKLSLTKPEYDAKMFYLGLRQKGAAFAGQGLFNSLEEVSIGLYPVIRRIKEKLLQKGAESVLMSGSGPAVFGIFQSPKAAQARGNRFKQENKFWQIFVVRTI